MNLVSLFFLFFGLAEEARKHYYDAATTLAKRVGLSTTFLERSSHGGNGYVFFCRERLQSLTESADLADPKA